MPAEINIDVRDVQIKNADGEQVWVKIVDQGEDFVNGEGRIPNHDKVHIEYPEEN